MSALRDGKNTAAALLLICDACSMIIRRRRGRLRLVIFHTYALFSVEGKSHAVRSSTCPQLGHSRGVFYERVSASIVSSCPL